MTALTLQTLVLISLVAVGAVFLVERFPRTRLNAVVLEILAGILIGPVLHWGHLTVVITNLASFGLALLMFTAGYEIDFDAVRGRPLRLSIIGWAISLVLGLSAGYLLQAQGRVLSGLVTGLALTTTAFGTMLPMWRDAGILHTRFGGQAVAIGTVGEFGPIVAIALLLGHGEKLSTTLLLVGFSVLAVVGAVLASRPRAPRTLELLRKHLHTSSQLPVRIVFLIVITLSWVAYRVGLDVLLGAFAAGIIVRIAARGRDEPLLRSKLEAISFGVFIPVFFVVSGMQFDLGALERDPVFLLNIPLFLMLFILVRGLPVLALYRRDLAGAELLPMILFSATALPLVVVITELGVASHDMLPQNAAALVSAAMLSVVIFPAVAFALLRRADIGVNPVPKEWERAPSEMGEI